MKLTKFRQAALGLALLTLGAQSATAGSFSFTGDFTHDEDVRLFNFSILANSSAVVVKTLSVDGGTNAAGNPIVGGGFETYLALFKADGEAITDTSNKTLGNDALITIVGTLLAGNYIVALTQYDNIALGNLGDGFAADLGLASFSGAPFSVFGGDGHWAVDITFVDSANPAGVGIPEPASLALTLTGLAGLGMSTRRRQASQ